VKYEDLTDIDKAILGLNGCGSKSFRVPNFFFEADCNHHDYGYWIGCTEADRKICDDKFYEAMKRDVARLPWYKKFHYITAYIFYLAVRLNGSRYFWYGDEKRVYRRSNS